MALPERLMLSGAVGSPYTRKMVALLRYRRIPHNMVWSGHVVDSDLPKAKVALLPTFYFPDEAGELKAVVDSTPIIRRLESEHSGRSTIPQDPALAFINYLLEDFGDEWVTKYMFHYRWAFQADIDWAAKLLPLWNGVSIAPDDLAKVGGYIADRQVSRIGVVGSNETTRPVIEDSYKRFLGLMDEHVQQQPYLFGQRPSSADYAIYGQLTQLTQVDPTPLALARQLSPRTVAWVDLMEDLSGLEPKADDWQSLEDQPDTLKALLAEVGSMYAPALLANAKAVQAGEPTWETEIGGKPWTQKTFPYQAKCLQWINEEYQGLSDADQARVDAVLVGTGCEAIIFK